MVQVMVGKISNGFNGSVEDGGCFPAYGQNQRKCIQWISPQSGGKRQTKFRNVINVEVNSLKALTHVIFDQFHWAKEWV